MDISNVLIIVLFVFSCILSYGLGLEIGEKRGYKRGIAVAQKMAVELKETIKKVRK